MFFVTGGISTDGAAIASHSSTYGNFMEPDEQLMQFLMRRSRERSNLLHYGNETT